MTNKIKKSDVRTRFAPSSTGKYLHLGGARTALFNYLYAKKTDGIFYMRIEDTDKSRFVPEAQKNFLESLKWLGIEPDETPENPGEYGPYVQSEREDIYRKHAEILISKNLAYWAFDSPEEIAEMKIKIGEGWNYGIKTRHLMKNSFTLPKEELDKLLSDDTVIKVLRFKVPENVEVIVEDLIHGNVVVNSNTLDDKVLLKSDGGATFSLASIVDDYHQKTSIVLRGLEWMPSSPGHVLIYNAFGWTPPKFAHLPLIMKPAIAGNGKLSKRDGEQYGFPIMIIGDEKVIGFSNAGYEPDAVFNFLALLGFNPGTEREIYSKEELIELFDITKISKSSAKFDIKKLMWFNSQYLKMKSDKELATILKEESVNSGKYNLNIYSDATLEEIARLSVERAELRSQMLSVVSFFFEEAKNFEEKALKKYDKSAATKISDWVHSNDFHNCNWIIEGIHEQIEKMTSEVLPIGKIAGSLRVILTGGVPGPDLPTIMKILGRDEVYHRVRTVTDLLGKDELETEAIV